MAWVHKLFGLCEHKWVVDKRLDLAVKSRITPTEVHSVGENVYCHCEKCGMPRLFQLEIR